MSEAEEIKRLRVLVDEGMKFKHRMQRVALAAEDKNVPVSVCDYCEETYPESWILDGICPYCGHAHNEENEDAIGGSPKKHASYCPVCDQYVPDGVGVIEDIIMSSGSVEYDIKNSVVMNAIGCYIHNLLKESGAPNFITSELGETKEVGTLASDRHRIYVTFGWANKKTPSQAINELNGRIKAYEQAMKQSQALSCHSAVELGKCIQEIVTDVVFTCVPDGVDGSLRTTILADEEPAIAFAQALVERASERTVGDYDWLLDYDLYGKNPQDFADRLSADWKHDYGKLVWDIDEERSVAKLTLATGGWSENEEIIMMMKQNFVLWSLSWVESQRGGLYKFEFPIY